MHTVATMNNILNDFAVGAKDVFGEKLKDVVLFGSYARGDYDDNSDVDLVILADISRDEEKNFTDDIVALMAKIDKKYEYVVLLSPIILSYSFFEQWSDIIPFYRAVKNEGVIINAQ